MLPDGYAAVRVSSAGYGTGLDQYDINVSVHRLIGALATAGNVAASLVKLGGVRSEAKRINARASGAKP